MEIWKDIPGYEGLYKVSNKGRVKSLHFNISTRKKETVLKQHDAWNGYLRVGLSKNGKNKLWAVHRLVALAFLQKVEGKDLVDHINGDRTDNRVENIRWCTHKENSQNSLKLRSSVKYNSIKVKDNQGNTFNSYREAARFWGYAPNTIKNDALGRTVYSNSQKGTSYERKVRFMKEE